MDERYDLIRSVRDEHFRYIRNYMPQLGWFNDQHISYMYEMPTMRSWQRLADAGKLSGAAAVYMAREKPVEELYDVDSDPFELRNLATAPEHRETLERLRGVHRRWQEETIDLGLLPEADLRTRFGNEAPYHGRPPRAGAFIRCSGSPRRRIWPVAANPHRSRGLPSC